MKEVFKPAADKKSSTFIVGLGASASGLEAFKELLSALRPESGMAFVFIQHSSPVHKTSMEAFETKFQANKVYAIPSDTAVELKDGSFQFLLNKEERPQKLEHISQKYKDLYEFAPVGYISLDERGKIVCLNDTAAVMLKLNKTELIGKALSRWMHKDSKTILMNHLSSCLKSSGTQKQICEFELLSHGNFRTSVEIVFQKLFDPEKQKFLINMSVTDITQKKKFQVIESKLKDMHEEKDLREKFVSTLTHDLRAPLTSSKLCAQMMEEEIAPGQRKERLQTILINELERADRMIRDLLDANAIHGNKNVPLIKKNCDLAAITENCMNKYRILNEGQVELNCSYSGNLVGFWSKDAMERIIENLISNALKYGKVGTPINLEMREVGTNVVITIHNHGQPISENDQKKIFEAFHRCDEAKSSHHTGWGLGLNLVNHLVQRHNGSITVDSGVECGTRFMIELPKNSERASGKKTDKKSIF